MKSRSNGALLNRTFAVLVVSLLALAAAATASAAGDAVYAGTLAEANSKAIPHAFVVQARGRRITRIVMQWRASCDSGYGIAFHGALRNAGKPPANGPGQITVGKSSLFAGKIGKTGKFKAVVYGSVDIGSTTYLANARTTLSGVLRARTGTGKLRAQTVIAPIFTGPPPSDFEPDVCDSGPMEWSVMRGAGVYGGSTAQGEPVAAFVSAKKVKRILFGWRADGCSGKGTWWDMPDEVIDFRLSPQRTFGDAFTYEEENDDGGKTVYGYNVRGRLKGRVLSGTFGVSPLVLDASGNPAGGCATPDVNWTARSG